MKKTVFLLCVILLITVLLSGCGDRNVEWPRTGLATQLPVPEIKVYSINEYKDRFNADFKNVSDASYQDYLDKCKSAGFSLDVKEDACSFDGYNAEGFRLNLTFFSNESLSLWLYAPVEMKALTWPDSNVGAIVPVPESLFGRIEWAEENSLCVYIGNTSATDYVEYKKACTDAGFSVNANDGDDFYYADDASGNHLNLNYLRFGTMRIRLDGADTPAESTTDDITMPLEADILPTESATYIDTTATEMIEQPTSEVSADAALKEAIDNMTYTIACSKSSSSSLRKTILFDFEKGIMTTLTIENHHHGGYWKTSGIKTCRIEGDLSSGWIKWVDEYQSLPYEFDGEMTIRAYDYKHEHYTEYHICDLDGAVNALIRGLNERESKEALALIAP